MIGDRPRKRPSEDGLLVWNGTVARIPPLAVQPTSLEELADAVEFARDHGLLVRIAGAGAEAGAGRSDRVVTIDVSLISEGPAKNA